MKTPGLKKQKGQFAGKHKEKSEYQMEKSASEVSGHHKKHHE